MSLEASLYHVSLHSSTEVLHFTGTKSKAYTKVHEAVQKTNNESEYAFAPQEYKYSATMLKKYKQFYLIYLASQD